MQGIKWLIAGMVAVIWVYSGAVILRDGLDFFTPFFSAILTVTWPGQFALDFLLYLLLSAFWVAWRHGFSGAGIALGAAMLFGAVVFLPYLLIAALRSSGDPVVFVTGANRQGRSGAF
ncbi:hypothetical protein [Nioella aestuarii]|uniref:hypothetical protein n=1 Tax=Nioella aestuarii TaxID=1662864 RepID=UPI003D7F35C7